MRTHIYSVLIAVTVFYSCQDKQQQNERYLKTVLNNLSEIKSATYHSQKEAWDPGDTLATYIVDLHAIEYVNDEDTTIGSTWLYLKMDSVKSFEYAYDGTIGVNIYEDQRVIRIDSFNTRNLPFRPVGPPFYNRTKNILQYILTTNDSLSLTTSDSDSILHLQLTILEENQIEFFGKAHRIPQPPFEIDPTSKYELWIDKSTNLPIKIKREMSHSISIETVSKPVFNQMDIGDFNLLAYLPADYDIIEKKRVNKEKVHDLIGKKAPNWSLVDYHGHMVNLEDIDSKAILIQFTSVHCGPCTASIPYLNKLKASYDEGDLKLIAIESYSQNSNVLEGYSKRNNFTYTFLHSELEVNDAYSITFTPIFFLLDEKHVVQKVFAGYSGQETNENISKVIDKLLLN